MWGRCRKVYGVSMEGVRGGEEGCGRGVEKCEERCERKYEMSGEVCWGVG